MAHDEFLAKAASGSIPRGGGIAMTLEATPTLYSHRLKNAPLSIARFTEESQRLLGVIDRRLQDKACLAGENDSIADIAAYSWMLSATTFLAPAMRQRRGGAQRGGSIELRLAPKH